MKSSKTSARLWFAWVIFSLGLAPQFTAHAGGLVINNNEYSLAAAAAGGVSTFSTNVVVSLTSASEVFTITNKVVLDATTNSANIIRTGGVAPIFYIKTNGSLTLINLNISGGLSTNGGAIFNAGTLILSNCVFTGNVASNASGADGADGDASNSGGGNGGNGFSASGGAIYSTGTLEVFNSIFSNNLAAAGNGGTGGNGASDFVFGGDGGNGGNGGSAFGGAIVCAGPSNLLLDSEFFGNACIAGGGGTGGTASGGDFSGKPGTSGTGGGAVGGAIWASGPVSMTNCVIADNSLTAGATAADGKPGGSASGGGVELAASATPSSIVNSTFFQNSAVGGTGGLGNYGGAAAGGGLASSATQANLLNCTIASNTLTAGSASAGGGLIGAVEGAAIARLAGSLRLGNSILSGGSNAIVTNLDSITYETNNQPNCYGAITDLGYNISSDATPDFSQKSSFVADPVLDTALSTPGSTTVGLYSLTTLSVLAALSGSPAIAALPGVPGLTFPAIDEAGQPRGTPSCIGAYEANPIETNGAAPFIGESPASQTNAVGATVLFEVSDVTNNAPSANLGYQWQFNGTNLSDSATVAGSWSSQLTLRKITQASAGVYTVIVGNSTLIGLATSGPAVLTVISPPRLVTQPPKGVTTVAGAIVSLSATASGSTPLSYQWRAGGTNLVSATEFSGANSNVLTISPVFPSDAGNYTLVVSNAYGLATSSVCALTVKADTTKPSVTIAAPTAGARTKQPILQGVASGSAQIAQVLYWLTNINGGLTVTNGAALLLYGNGVSSNWVVPFIPLPGTNIFGVQSVDTNGLVSTIATREFFYEVAAPFSLQLAGTGSGKFTGTASVAGNTPPTNGALLNLGEGYTITATANADSLFSNWVSGSLVSNSTTLKFIMNSNLAQFGLTANFSTNFFLGAAGAYNGLFAPVGLPVSATNAGMLYNLQLLKSGSFTATLYYGGQHYSLNTNFNLASQCALHAGPLQVVLNLDAAAPQITGLVSNANFAAALRADRAAATPAAARYTLLFAPGSAVTPNSPPGDGFALLSQTKGTVTLSGNLADGNLYSQTAPASAVGDLPIYESLYGGGGLVLGWVNLTNPAALPPTNQVTWIKPAAKSGNYAGGFTNLLTAEISAWTNPPARTAAVSLTNGLLVISNASVDLVYTNVFVNPSDQVAKTGGAATNTLSGTITVGTGAWTMTFGNNGLRSGTTTVHGAVLQDSGAAGGYFLTATNSGSAILTPP